MSSRLLGRVFTALFTLLVLAGAPTRALGSSISYQFAGLFYGGESYAANAPVVGQFTYDAAAVGSFNTFTGSTDYYGPAITNFSVTTPGGTYSGSGGVIALYNNMFLSGTTYHDRFVLTATATSGPTPLNFFQIDLFQAGTLASTPLLGTASSLPTALTLAGVNGSGRVFIDSAHQNGFRLTSLTPVPEPGSLMLLAIGLVAIGMFHRRRRPA